MIYRIALMAAFAFGAATLPATAEKRLALVVGNSAYVHSSQLANPANDAGDMAASLKAAGFDVILGLDLDKRGFETKVREFARALGSADVGLLFYAGHAMQVGGTNYLLPVDAQLESDRDLEFETIRLELILAQMELGREGKTNIVFLDACRDNPLSRSLARSMGTRSASLGRGLAQVQSGVGTFVSYSTQPNNVALDGTGRNSPYTSALARHITSEGRNLNAVMIDVRKDVIAATQGKQVPWDHSALTGEFYFKPGLGGASVNPEVARLEASNQALQARLEATADAETVARLAVLRERRRDLERGADQARKAHTEHQFKSMRETDPKRRQDMVMDGFALQRAISDRQRDLKQTNDEIASLEAKSKEPATVPKSGVQTAALPVGAQSSAKPAEAQAPSATGKAVVRRFASFAPVSKDAEVDVYRNARVRGQLIEAGSTDTIEECMSTCRTDSLCLAFAIEAKTGICETYKSIDGLQQEAGWNAGVRNR